MVLHAQAAVAKREAEHSCAVEAASLSIASSSPAHSAESDEGYSRLLAAARRRDQQAFGGLVERHQQLVRGYLLRLCKGDHAGADDLAQNTFLAAWRRIDSFRADGSFEAWLMRIATNEFRMAWRKRGPDTTEIDPEAIELAVTDPETSDLDGLLAMLEPPARAALVLNSGHGYSHREIAEVLDLPIGTVKSLIHRAKLTLRARLTPTEAPS